MKNSINSELIEQYLVGNLKGEQLQQFDALMKSDPLFKGEVEFQKDIVESITEHRKLELKTKLSNVNVNSGLSNTQKITIAAASIFAVLAGGYSAYVFTKTEAPAVVIETAHQEEVVVNDVASEVLLAEVEQLSDVDVQSTQVEVVQPKADNNTTETQVVVVPNELPSTTVNAVPFADAMEMDEDKLLEDGAGGVSPLLKIADNATFKKASHIKPKTEGGNRLKYIYNGTELVLIGDKFQEHSQTFTLLMDEQTDDLYLAFENEYYEIENHHNVHTYKLIPITSLEDINKLKKAE